jgi:hypothetical protein
MMRNLEKRLEKLEQVYSPIEIIVIMLTDFCKGEINGWRGEGIYIARNPRESEEALAKRAATEARLHHNQHPSPLPGYIVLQMDRQYVLYLKPESRPEPIPEARVTPKGQPELREVKVIRHWMT